MLLTISGPSGAGKSTLAAKLVLEIGAKFLPSWTTRPPRTNTKIDTPYHYVSVSEYLALSTSGILLLDEYIALNHYGTRTDDVTFALQNTAVVWLADLTGKSVLDLIYKGFIPNLCIIFDITKSESQRRMEQRNDNQFDINNRLQRYEDEVYHCEKLKDLHNNVLTISAFTNPEIILKLS